MIEQSYSVNRQNFIKAAEDAGARIVALPYKGKVADGAILATDVALLGPDDASQVVIVASGLHGVELPAGSLLQQLWLQELKQSLASFKDTRFVFVHALNPHGAAFGLRTDWDANGQGNIDPARNFVNFRNPEAVTNRANDDISKILKRADLSRFASILMWKRLLYSAFVKQGKSNFKRGFVRGQYSNPDIPYYGGASPSLSRLTWDEVIKRFVRGPYVKKIWHLDCHTGDGPFGLLQLYINDREGEHVYKNAQRLIAIEHVQNTPTYFANIAGDIVDYWDQCDVRGIEVTPITLEFGTSTAAIEGIDTLHAILTRTILLQKYKDQHAQAGKIIQRMHDAFAPRESTWEKAIRLQSQALWQNLKDILSQ